MAIETEIKIEMDVGEWESFRQQLAEKTELVAPLQEELNVLYDQQDQLRDGGCTLRLRSYGGRALLTYKGPVDKSSPFKQRPEFQTIVEREEMEGILTGLGYRPSFRYDKFREIRRWRLGGGELEVCFDHTPVGHFVEVEGTPELLNQAVKELGWNPDQFIRKSYLDLYAERLPSQDRARD